MRVSCTPLEIVATHAVIVFQVPHDRFYRRAALTQGLVSTKHISTRIVFQVPYDRFYRRAALTQGLVSTKRISTNMALLSWYHHRCTTHWIMTTIDLVYQHARTMLTCPLRYLISSSRSGCSIMRVTHKTGAPYYYMETLLPNASCLCAFPLAIQLTAGSWRL
jgi:hypothetical protein